MRRITLKVGSGVLTENSEVAKSRMLNLVTFIVKLKQRYEVIIVTSGAVAAGYTALKLNRKKISARSYWPRMSANSHEQL